MVAAAAVAKAQSKLYFLLKSGLSINNAIIPIVFIFFKILIQKSFYYQLIRGYPKIYTHSSPNQVPERKGEYWQIIENLHPRS